MVFTPIVVTPIIIHSVSQTRPDFVYNPDLIRCADGIYRPWTPPQRYINKRHKKNGKNKNGRKNR